MNIIILIAKLTEEFATGPRVWLAEANEIAGYHARAVPLEIVPGVREVGSFEWDAAAKFTTANACRRWIAARHLSTSFSPTGYPIAP